MKDDHIYTYAEYCARTGRPAVAPEDYQHPGVFYHACDDMLPMPDLSIRWQTIPPDAPAPRWWLDMGANGYLSAMTITHCSFCGAELLAPKEEE